MTTLKYLIIMTLTVQRYLGLADWPIVFKTTIGNGWMGKMIRMKIAFLLKQERLTIRPVLTTGPMRI